MEAPVDKPTDYTATPFWPDSVPALAASISITDAPVVVLTRAEYEELIALLIPPKGDSDE